jgi:hypothetical protein
VWDFTLEDEFVVLGRAVDADARSEDLNEAPTIASALMDLLLIVFARLASGGTPAFAKTDELVFVTRIVARRHGHRVHLIPGEVDYKRAGGLEPGGAAATGNETPEMKVVGRNARGRAGLAGADAMRRLANELRQGKPFMPKGVFRFKTFEEADAWKLQMLTATKTSWTGLAELLRSSGKTI